MTAIIEPSPPAPAVTHRITVTRPIVALSLLVVPLFDLSMKDGVLCSGFSLLLIATAVLCWRVQPNARFIPAALLALAPWFVLRDSVALAALNACTAIVLVGAFVALEPAGMRTRLIDSDRAVLRLFAAFAMSPITAVQIAQPILDARSDHVARARRSIIASLAGAPVVIAVVGLLASADKVFASFLRFPASAERVTVHALLLACGAWLAVVLIGRRSTNVEAIIDGYHGRPADLAWPRPLPMSILLWSLTGVIGVFNLNWIVAAAGGDSYVQSRASLTYAQYARQGYFQLLWVSGIVMATLLVAAWVIARREPGSRAVRNGAWAVSAMTIALLAGAIYRLSLYFDAYGYTLLRLWCVVFAVWLAVAFAVLVFRRFESLARIVCASALGAVVTFSAINPEALIARRNTERTPIDFDYLQSLSADADVVVGKRLSRLSPADAVTARAYLCDRAQHERGFWSWNRSASHAPSRTVCRTPR